MAVGDDDGLLDLAINLEVLAQTGVGRMVRQAADEDLGERRVLDGRAAGRRGGRGGNEGGGGRGGRAGAAPAARRGHARRVAAAPAAVEDGRQAARQRCLLRLWLLLPLLLLLEVVRHQHSLGTGSRGALLRRAQRVSVRLRRD